MAHGFMFLCAIMDWTTRKVLAWRISTTLTSDFCIDALEEALRRFGTPEIFDTDQGAPFTSADFLAILRAHHIQISMDGQGCWQDNVFGAMLSARLVEAYVREHGPVEADYCKAECWLVGPTQRSVFRLQ